MRNITTPMLEHASQNGTLIETNFWQHPRGTAQRQQPIKCAEKEFREFVLHRHLEWKQAFNIFPNRLIDYKLALIFLFFCFLYFKYIYVCMFRQLLCGWQILLVRVWTASEANSEANGNVYGKARATQGERNKQVVS